MPRAKLYAKSHALLPAILNKARGDEAGEVFWVRCVGGGGGVGGDSGRVLVRWLWAGVGSALAAVIRVGCWCVGGGGGVGGDSGRARCVGGGGGDSGRVLGGALALGGRWRALAAVIRVGCWWCVGSGRALAVRWRR